MMLQENSPHSWVRLAISCDVWEVENKQLYCYYTEIFCCQSQPNISFENRRRGPNNILLLGGGGLGTWCIMLLQLHCWDKLLRPHTNTDWPDRYQPLQTTLHQSPADLRLWQVLLVILMIELSQQSAEGRVNTTSVRGQKIFGLLKIFYSQ